MMKILNISISFVLLLFTFHFSLFTINAQEPATASASLLQKLNALKAEIASKATALKLDVNKKLTNRVISGQIVNIGDLESSSSPVKITVATSKGNKDILVDEYALYQNNISTKKAVRKNSLSLKDLAKDDYIYGLGDIDDKQILVAKKIVKTDPPEKDNLRILWGIAETTKLPYITLKLKDGTLQTIEISVKTVYQTLKGDTAFGNITGGSSLVVVGNIKESTISARFIYLFPTGTLKIKEKSTTPSASAKSKNL